MLLQGNEFMKSSVSFFQCKKALSRLASLLIKNLTFLNYCSSDDIGELSHAHDNDAMGWRGSATKVPCEDAGSHGAVAERGSAASVVEAMAAL
jgi:hypothetical protein